VKNTGLFSLFVYFLKKLHRRYSFELQRLRNIRPISAHIGLINTDIALEKTPLFLYNTTIVEFFLVLGWFIWNHHEST